MGFIYSLIEISGRFEFEFNRYLYLLCLSLKWPLLFLKNYFLRKFFLINFCSFLIAKRFKFLNISYSKIKLRKKKKSNLHQSIKPGIKVTISKWKSLPPLKWAPFEVYPTTPTPSIWSASGEKINGVWGEASCPPITFYS